jgi:DNA-binding LacI/PurR family transcriptional regulator
MKRVTRRDVAKKAGVTETIVSYVVNNNRYVDKEKRERVEDAIKELGYRPSPMARALKGKKTGHILFIADDLKSEHFGSIICEMEKIASDKGLIVSLCQDSDDPAFLQSVQDWLFDGIIIGSATISDEVIQHILDIGVPTVLLEIRKLPVFHGTYGTINSGLYEGARECIRLFREKGRKKIAFVASVGQKLEDDDFRYQGYKDCVPEAERLVIRDADDEDALSHMVQEMYRKNAFDALFCRTDISACVAIKALEAMGVPVPSAVSVIGCNDSLVGRFLDPPLTSIHIRRDLLAKNALSMLEQLKKGAVVPLGVQLQTELVMRESV